MTSIAFVGASVPLMADIPVHKMMERLQASYPERRDELVEMLGIDLNWHMHQLSDGQRRRVQLMIGLIRPFKILLMDEITTSLDVCVRQDLLNWLVKESEERQATILYATHIFDGLDDWVCHHSYERKSQKSAFLHHGWKMWFLDRSVDSNHSCPPRSLRFPNDTRHHISFTWPIKVDVVGRGRWMN